MNAKSGSQSSQPFTSSAHHSNSRHCRNRPRYTLKRRAQRQYAHQPCLLCLAALAAILIHTVQGIAAPPADNAGIIPVEFATTHITSPITQNGRVNYVEALNQLGSRGVTPQNNAAIPLLALFWDKLGIGTWKKIKTGYAFAPDLLQQKQLLAGMGVGKSSLTGPRYQTLNDYIASIQARQITGLSGAAATLKLNSVIGRLHQIRASAESRPWSRQRIPLLAGWIRRNDPALNAAESAANLPKFYVPAIILHRHVGLVGNQLPFLATLRELSLGLAVRAMLELHQGHLAHCENDLMAIHRLARLITQSPMLISELEGFAIDYTACQGDWALANAGWVSRREYQSYARKLQGLARLSGLRTDFNCGERFLLLDLLQRLTDRGVRQTLSATGLGNLLPDQRWTIKDSIAAMRLTNRIADRLTAAMAHRDFIKRHTAAIRVKIWLTHILAANSHAGTRRARMLLKSLSDHFDRVVLMQTSARAASDLDRIVMAIAACRADHGIYPNALANISPKYIAQLPQDPFTDRPLFYAITATGCRIWSQSKFNRRTAPFLFISSRYQIQVRLTFPPGRYPPINIKP